MECNYKIVFAGVNASYSHSMLAYGCLRAFTEIHAPQWQWQCVETTINDDEETFAIRLLESDPAILCGTAYLFNQDYLLRVIARVKALRPMLRIYLGGPQFVGNNEQFLRRHSYVNAVIRGDESSFYRLLNGETDAPGVCRIDNTGYCDNGIAHFNGAPDDLPSPYLLGYFPPGKPFYLLETSRGCTAQCTFCTSANTGLIHFSLERVRRDLQVLRQSGVRDIRVLDRTFNHGGARPLELLRLFREEFPELHFHLEINPALVGSDLLAEIKQFPQGALHLEAGVQSLTPEVLAAIKRSAISEKMLFALRRLQDCGNLIVHADLIAGLPRQTWLSLVADATTLIAAQTEEIQLENLKILPGTALAQQPPPGMAANPEPPYEVLQTATFTVDELQQARILSRILDSYYNHSPLRHVFACMVLNDSAFIVEYIEFLRRRVDPLLKHSPARRLELLEEFARETARPLLLELVKFLWLWEGMSAEKYGLTVHKCVRAAISAGPVIWRDGQEQEPVRFFTAGFAYRVADIITSSAEPPALPSEYVFYLRHGQKTVAVTAL